MKALLDALVTAISADLTYLRWTGVLDSELLPPEEPGFPLVGLKDGGITRESRPNKKDIETLTVLVIPYQSLFLAEPGGAVLGSTAQLGTQGTGLLAMGAALKTLLDDNFLGLNFYWAHCDRESPTDTLAGDDGNLIQLQRYTFSYRRYV